MHSDDGKEWEDDIDSSIVLPSDDKEEWIPTIFQRIVAGVVITIIYFLIGIIFWEDYKLGLGFGIVIFVFTVLFGEKFLKVLAAILRVSGPI